MQSKKQVTNQQGLRFASIARENKLLRSILAEFLSDPYMTREFFRELIAKDLIKKARTIGARIIFANEGAYREIPVWHGASLRHIVTASEEWPHSTAYPKNQNLERLDYIQELYKATENGTECECIALLNWPNGDGSFKKAKEFAKSNNFRRSTLEAPFMVGYHHRYRVFATNSPIMRIIETTGCKIEKTLKAACVEVRSDSTVSPYMVHQKDMGGKDDWFAIRL